jgi:hypothetical protein
MKFAPVLCALLLAAGAVAPAGAAAAEDAGLDRILCRVAGEPVRVRDVAREVLPAVGAEALRRLINERTLAFNMDRSGVRVDDNEIDDKINALLALKGRELGGKTVTLKMLLDDIRQTEDGFRIQVRTLVGLDKIMYDRSKPVEKPPATLQEWQEYARSRYELLEKLRQSLVIDLAAAPLPPRVRRAFLGTAAGAPSFKPAPRWVELPEGVVARVSGLDVAESNLLLESFAASRGAGPLTGKKKSEFDRVLEEIVFLRLAERRLRAAGLQVEQSDRDEYVRWKRLVFSISPACRRYAKIKPGLALDAYFDLFFQQQGGLERADFFADIQCRRERALFRLAREGVDAAAVKAHFGTPGVAARLGDGDAQARIISFQTNFMSKIYKLERDSIAARAKAQEFAESFHKRAKSGTVPFDRLIREALALNLTRTASDLGYVVEGELSKELHNELARMNPGDIALVSDPEGWHLLEVVGRRAVTFREVPDQTWADLIRDREHEIQKSIEEEAKKDKLVAPAEEDGTKGPAKEGVKEAAP